MLSRRSGIVVSPRHVRSRLTILALIATTATGAHAQAVGTKVLVPPPDKRVPVPISRLPISGTGSIGGVAIRTAALQVVGTGALGGIAIRTTPLQVTGTGALGGIAIRTAPLQVIGTGAQGGIAIRTAPLQVTGIRTP